MKRAAIALAIWVVVAAFSGPMRVPQRSQNASPRVPTVAEFSEILKGAPDERARQPLPPVSLPMQDALNRMLRGKQLFDVQIFNGVDADPKDWPFTASLAPTPGAASHHFCGAAIVANRAVVTAAHCVPDTPPEWVTAWYGSIRLSTMAQFARTQQIHDFNFNAADWTNDIALLEVITPVQPRIALADLTIDSILEQQRPKLHVAGWGKVTQGGSTSDQLQTAEVDYVPFSECNKEYGGALVRSQLCAGRATTNTCGKDSGGPLVWRSPNGPILVGIVSYGHNRCEGTALPGVYTRISAFADRIRNVVP